MIQGVRSGSVTKKGDKKKDEVADNVVKYINMEREGGHHMYGMGFMFCQVGMNIGLLEKMRNIFLFLYNNRKIYQQFQYCISFHYLTIRYLST